MLRFMAERGDVSGNSLLAAGVDRRGGTAPLDVPAEQLTEELLRFGAVPASDFKMHNGVCHVLSSGLSSASRL